MKVRAKINAGVPAKPNLYRPLEKNENKKVWPLLERGAFVIAKGYEYEWLGEGKPSSELFEISKDDRKSVDKQFNDTTSSKRK